MLADRLRMAGGNKGIQFVGFNWDSALSTGGASYTLGFGTGGFNGSFQGTLTPRVDDLAIVISAFGTGVAGDHTFTAPTGYTKLLDLYQANTHSIHACISYQFLTGAAPSSITIPGCGFNTSIQLSRVMVFRGVNKITPFDVTSTTSSSAATIDLDPPAITPVTARSWIIPVGARVGKDDTTSFGYNPPGDLDDPFGIASFVGLGNATPPGTGIYGGNYDQWTSGSYDPGAWTAAYSTSIGGYVAATMALRPL